MEVIKTKDADKPRLKPNAGRFGKWWYKHRMKKYNRQYDHYDKRRKWVAIKYFSFLGLAIFFVIAARLTTNATNVQSTPLNKEMSFGSNGKSAVITKRIYNPDTGTLLLKFRIDSGDGNEFTAVDLDKIKLTFDGDRFNKNTTRLTVYPTSQNTLALQYTKLSGGFQDMRVTFHDKTGNDSDLGAVSSVSSSTTSMSGLAKQDATIIVNNDKVTVDKNLGTYSQRQLAIQQVSDDIDTQKQLIKANKEAISKLNSLKQDQKNDIKLKQLQADSLTDDDRQKLQSSIQGDQEKITSINEKIADANTQIKNAKVQISALNNNRIKLEHGAMNLPKPY